MFDEKARCQFFLEDGEFTNIKQYFWARQCLRLFSQYIRNTISSALGIFKDATIFRLEGKDKGENEKRKKRSGEVEKSLYPISSGCKSASWTKSKSLKVFINR